MTEQFKARRLSGWVTAFTLGGLLFFPALSMAQMRITEYAYSGNGAAGEFMEFTNIGVAAIDMTGWTYDDSDMMDGPATPLTAFGIVAPGESVILSEATAPVFRASYGLPMSVKIIGANTNNLGRNDEINLFDDSSALVDRLTYGDQTFPGTIRTQGASGWPCSSVIGTNTIAGWVLSTIADQQGSISSSEGNVGNPGSFVSFNCAPAPTGACCEAGVCNERTAVDCAPVGLYQGDGTGCTIMCPAPSGANVRITEYMPSGNGGEFIEFTNLGGTPVDMSGWSYSDVSRLRGQVNLSAFGTLAAGESVILTESIAGDFSVDWQLSGVTIIGGNTVNLGGNDEINLYDNSGAQVDRLTYGPANFPGSINADGTSGWPCASAVGTNDIFNWRRAAIGDGQSSFLSLLGDVGSPGQYASTICAPGSCCTSGVCSVQTLNACLQSGGLFLGDGTNCTNNPCPPPSDGQLRITEFMYQGNGAEFAEYTNIGMTPVDMTGWSFSDDGTPGLFDLSGFGTVQPGEGVIMTAVNPVVFRADWSLAPTVKVVRLSTNELGRNDVIQLYDNSGTLVDQIEYGDETFTGTIQTLNVSGWPLGSAVGQNDIDGWLLSSNGDQQNSYTSGGGDVGNPGTFVLVQQTLPPAAPSGVQAVHNRQKNRYISFEPNNDGVVAFRVQKAASMAGTGFCTSSGASCSGAPAQGTCSGGQLCVAPFPGGSPAHSCWVQTPAQSGLDINTAKCDATPNFRVWTEPVVHVGDCEIIPNSDYTVFTNMAGPIEIPTGLAIKTAEVASLNTKVWADSVGSFNGVEWTAPNRFTNVQDVLGILSFISNSASRPEFPVVNLQAVSAPDSCLNPFVNTADVLIAVRGVAGDTYGPPNSGKIINTTTCPVCP